MMVFGEPDLWSDIFPEDRVPLVLDLITDTWATLKMSSLSELEVHITRRFEQALKQAKDFKGLPFRLEREAAEDDPVS